MTVVMQQADHALISHCNLQLDLRWYSVGGKIVEFKSDIEKRNKN